MVNVLVLDAKTKQLFNKEITGDYKSIQQEVEGMIDCPFVSESLFNQGIVVYVNDEGKILNKEVAAYVVHDGEVIECLNGNVVFTADNGYGETVSLTAEQEFYIRHMLENSGYCEDIEGNRYPVISY